MEMFEVQQKDTLTRKEVATRLRRLANLLAEDDEEIAFERGGMEFKVNMPGQSAPSWPSSASPVTLPGRISVAASV